MRLPWLRGDEVAYVTNDRQVVRGTVIEEVAGSVEMKTAGGMIVTGRIEHVFRHRDCPHDAPLWLIVPEWFGRDLLWPVGEAG